MMEQDSWGDRDTRISSPIKAMGGMETLECAAIALFMPLPETKEACTLLFALSVRALCKSSTRSPHFREKSGAFLSAVRRRESFFSAEEGLRKWGVHPVTSLAASSMARKITSD